MEPEAERELASDLFNKVWTLIQMKGRSPAQDDEMLHAAHASRYHWGQVGEPVNLARGEWQCSRVYSVLGRSEPALHHARRSLEICQDNQIGDFDLAFAHEALARAHGVAGETHLAKQHADLAVQAADQIAEDDDKQLLLQDLATLD